MNNGPADICFDNATVALGWSSAFPQLFHTTLWKLTVTDLNPDPKIVKQRYKAWQNEAKCFLAF